jgi:uncharacterized membrane protein
MWLMKWVASSVLLILLFIVPARVYADDSWLIENFNSSIAIQQSGVVRVVETISVDFKDQPKHGIYRDIPYLYETNGKQTYSQLDITNVLQNNMPAHYTVSQTNGYEELKIGDPNQTIIGRNVYTITYTVTGVLRGYPDHDELYWNVTGNDWQVEIQRTEATVTLPTNGVNTVTCFEGVAGSQMPCQSNLTSRQTATFGTTAPLAESEGLTVVVGYKKGLIPILTAIPPKSYWQKLIEWQSLPAILAIALAGIVFIMYRWYWYGRDYWFAGNLFGTKDQWGSIKPIGAHETISVEFVPPERLRPAEIGVLFDERADTRDVTATIIDLATRGYLKITEVPKKWLFGKVDYLLTKTIPTSKNHTQTLLSYEQLLLNKLFYKRAQVKISTLKTTFYQDLAIVKKALYAEVVAKNLFPADPEKIRNSYRALAILCTGGGVGLFFVGLTINFVLPGMVGAGLFIDGIFFFSMVRYMPRKTAYGRDLYRRSKGYYLFIDKAEKYRQKYFEKENMFNEVLPYAIMFGLTGKFAKKMEKIGLKPGRTDWYVGSQPFATGLFISNVDNFSDSFSTAIASTPSKSGGFSGGSSDGGFGGGGGGSW